MHKTCEEADGDGYGANVVGHVNSFGRNVIVFRRAQQQKFIEAMFRLPPFNLGFLGLKIYPNRGMLVLATELPTITRHFPEWFSKRFIEFWVPL